jgi:hypothetical protein
LEEAGTSAEVTAQADLPEVTAPSLYDCVGARLDTLIPSFGLAEERTSIRHAYRLLCREPLGLSTWRRPSRVSRLNADGMPFQFGLTLGASGSPLQFVTETGPPLAGNAERAAAARQGIRRLAVLAGTREGLSLVTELLGELAPPDDPDLLAEDAGAFWIGAAFAPGRSPRLKVYVNAKWGGHEDRWARLAAFADRVGAAHEWKARRGMVEELEPLGISLTLAADAAPAARIYLSGYGRSFSYYERLGAACGGPAFAELLRLYGQTMLADDYRYPTRSAVWSLGTVAGSLTDCKLELCGHCAFDSDARIRAHCVEWLQHVNVSPELYLRMVDVLSGGTLSAVDAKLHAYVGVGVNRGRPYSTFYFNPAAGLP